MPTYIYSIYWAWNDIILHCVNRALQLPVGNFHHPCTLIICNAKGIHHGILLRALGAPPPSQILAACKLMTKINDWAARVLHSSVFIMIVASILMACSWGWPVSLLELWSCIISWTGIQLAKASMCVCALVWNCIKLICSVKTMYQYVDAYVQISMQLYIYMEFTPCNDRVYSYTCSPAAASWVGGGGSGSWPKLPPSYLLPDVTNSVSPMTTIILRPSSHWPPEVKTSSSALWWPLE